MRIWLTRIVRTALIAGGLLLLGSGVADAATLPGQPTNLPNLPAPTVVAPGTGAVSGPNLMRAGTPAALLSEVPGLGGVTGGLAGLGQSGIAHPMY